MPKLTPERIKFLELRHRRILQGIVIQLTVLVGMSAAISLLTTKLSLNNVSVIFYNYLLIGVVFVWVYIIYTINSITLIKIEQELGHSREDKFSKFNVIPFDLKLLVIVWSVITVLLFLIFVCSLYFNTVGI